MNCFKLRLNWLHKTRIFILNTFMYLIYLTLFRYDIWLYTTLDKQTFLLWSFEDGHRPILRLWSMRLRMFENSRKRSKKVENGRELSKSVENSWDKTSKKQFHCFFDFFWFFWLQKWQFLIKSFWLNSQTLIRLFSTVLDLPRLFFDRSGSMNVRWRLELIFEWSQKFFSRSNI